MKLCSKDKFLLMGGIIAGCAAVWHLLMIIGGPNWYAFARAPNYIVASVEQGTFIAPASALGISALLFTCAAYAISGAGLFCKIPPLKVALPTISLICLARGGYFSPIFFPLDVLGAWHLTASAVWFFVGVFLMGTIKHNRAK